MVWLYTVGSNENASAGKEEQVYCIEEAQPVHGPLDRLDRKLALGLKTSLPEPESSSWNISDIVIIDLKVAKKDVL